jgi:ribosomal-protein-alanine N-acetyltransferase
VTKASSLLLRQGVASDADALADLAMAAWERDLRPFLRGAAASREDEYDRLRAAVEDGHRRIIVAEIDGRPLGWCQRLAGRAYIAFLFVSPGSQNRGIGKALLRRTESMLELDGADRVQLDTLADNVRAVNFYRHQGYQILALKTDGRAGSDLAVSVRLEKRLDPWHGPIDDIRNE